MCTARPGRARGCAKPTFFGNRLIVCQITGKNGAEFKNVVENRFCGHSGVWVRPRARQINFFGNRLVVRQITGKNGTEFKNHVLILFALHARRARGAPYHRELFLKEGFSTFFRLVFCLHSVYIINYKYRSTFTHFFLPSCDLSSCRTVNQLQQRYSY